MLGAEPLHSVPYLTFHKIKKEPWIITRGVREVVSSELLGGVGLGF
jgi:hypothetical protein